MIDIEAKKQAVAEILEGRVVQDDARVAVCVKGSVIGFPATLEAVSTGWPFGVMYSLDTQVIEDPNKPKSKSPLEMMILPRMGQGFLRFFAHVVLFESKGMPVGDKQLESKFVFDYSDKQLTERFVKYPGMSERLLKLEQFSRFTELSIKCDAGLFLSQPKSFVALDLDICRETFRLLGEIGQIVFEAF